MVREKLCARTSCDFYGELESSIGSFVWVNEYGQTTCSVLTSRSFDNSTYNTTTKHFPKSKHCRIENAPQNGRIYNNVNGNNDKNPHCREFVRRITKPQNIEVFIRRFVPRARVFSWTEPHHIPPQTLTLYVETRKTIWYSRHFLQALGFKIMPRNIREWLCDILFIIFRDIERSLLFGFLCAEVAEVFEASITSQNMIHWEL